MKAGIVTDRNFHHLQAGGVKLSGHLDADYTARGFQPDGLKDPPPYQPEVAVHVPDGERECKAHRATVGGTNPDAVPGIRTLHLIPVNKIDTWTQLSQKIVDFADVVLPVS